MRAQLCWTSQGQNSGSLLNALVGARCPFSVSLSLRSKLRHKSNCARRCMRVSNAYPKWHFQNDLGDRWSTSWLLVVQEPRSYFNPRCRKAVHYLPCYLLSQKILIYLLAIAVSSSSYRSFSEAVVVFSFVKAPIGTYATSVPNAPACQRC